MNLLGKIKRVSDPVTITRQDFSKMYRYEVIFEAEGNAFLASMWRNSQKDAPIAGQIGTSDLSFEVQEYQKKDGSGTGIFQRISMRNWRLANAPIPAASDAAAADAMEAKENTF